MSGISRRITTFAEFNTLPDYLKRMYVERVQFTYCVGLTDIYRSLEGCPMTSKAFMEYLNTHSVFGNRSQAKKNTSPLWPFFLAGLATTDGQLIRPPEAEPAPPKPDPAHLEITGGPKPLLDILSVIFSSPEILDASRYKITIQEMTTT